MSAQRIPTVTVIDEKLVCWNCFYAIGYNYWDGFEPPRVKADMDEGILWAQSDIDDCSGDGISDCFCAACDKGYGGLRFKVYRVRPPMEIDRSHFP